LFHPVFNPKRGEEKLKGRHPKRERVVMFAFGNVSTTKPSMFSFANFIMSGRAWRFHPLTTRRYQLKPANGRTSLRKVAPGNWNGYVQIAISPVGRKPISFIFLEVFGGKTFQRLLTAKM
jgi:hypothetical protein